MCVILLGELSHLGNEWRSEAGGGKTFSLAAFLEVTCTSSPHQSVGGPRAGETRGDSSGSPRCVRIFRMGPGSVMKLDLVENASC